MVYLTLTNVVFECAIICDCNLSIAYLTLTNVVFESLYSNSLVLHLT